MNKTTLYNCIFALIATLAITYFFPHPEANHFKFEEGRPWNYAQLIAPFDIPIRTDSATVLRVRDSLDRTFVPVFERKPEAANQIITALLGAWAPDAGAPPVSQAEEQMRRKTVSYIRQAYLTDVMDEEYGDKMDRGTLSSIRIVDNNTVRPATIKGLRHIGDVLAEMPAAIGSDTLAARQWMKDNDIAEALVPNLAYDQVTSERLYQSDLDRFTAVKGVIQQGQTIIDKGALITPQDYTNLLTYESMLNDQLSHTRGSIWLMWLGQFLYAAIIIASLLAFLGFSAPDVWRNNRAVLFVMSIIAIMFILGVLVDKSLYCGIFVVPMMMMPVLMVVFFDASTALFSTMALTLLCAGAVSLPLEFIVLQTSASIASVYSLRELTRRSQLLRTSLFVALAYLASYVAIEFMLNGGTGGMQLRIVIYLAISAVLSSMAYVIMVPIERLFGFVSVVTLIELADTNNPLLRQLSQECPGTFQHSMAVSNLATDAAIRIGANEQMVRAGAMYHDIGKMSNPNFFTENQRGVNPHDSLPIDRSAQIIIGHVNDGVARADKAGLPTMIKDFIRQHHGAGKAKYFYLTYCNQHPGEEVDPTPFEYPGPNPQTREASILMMADAVEAASRSLKEHTQQSIEGLVNKIIDGQIAEGLHNESPLHFRDVDIIKQAFIRRLMTMYHNRISYPTN